jgi:hypothetical protein
VVLHALHGGVAMGTQDFVVIDFVVVEESVSGLAFGFVAIASGRDAEAGFAGEAFEDAMSALVEAQVIEVERSEFVKDPRVHGSVSKVAEVEEEVRERESPSAESKPARNNTHRVKPERLISRKLV